MDKYKRVGLYALCGLCGIYTADMIYRIVRYISAMQKGDAYEKLVLLLGTILNDGSSFMILNAVCLALMLVSVFLIKGVFRKRTVVVFAANIISSFTIIISTSNGDAGLNEFTTIISVAAASAPVFILTGLWCIYFCIKDLCNYFLKLEENNK